MSKLEIDTDDYLCLIGQLEKGGLLTLNLKYFSLNKLRTLSVETDSRSIVLDILNSKITYYSGNTVKEVNSDYLFSSTYEDQHKAILEGDHSNICSLDEGLRVMEVINSVQLASQK